MAGAKSDAGCEAKKKIRRQKSKSNSGAEAPAQGGAQKEGEANVS